jgi:hypothetical protein
VNSGNRLPDGISAEEPQASKETAGMQSRSTTAARILSAGHVRVNRDRTPIGGAAESCDGRPRVETREQGGIVREIIVICACGQNIILNCDYGPGPTPR